MRFSSSKAAFASGMCNSRGILYSSSNYNSYASSSTNPVTVKSEQGSKSPKVDASKSSSTNSASAKNATGSKSPKVIKRSDLGRTKFGSKEDGTNSCHIMSFEVMNAVLEHTPGRPYSKEHVEQIIRELNADSNLRIKTRNGNMRGCDGYSGDVYYDGMIEDAIKGKIDCLTNQRCVDRLERQWESVQQSNLDRNVKENIRAIFCQIKDQNGNTIIRSNASLE